MQMQPQLERTATRLNNVQSGFAVHPSSLAAAKSQLLNNQAVQLSGSVDINEVKSAHKQEKDAEDAQEKTVGKRVSAAELMSVYKCLGPAAAGIGYGLIFKGGSVLFAVLMSLLASSASVVAVNKIHKEDGEFSKGLVNWSGKIMGLFGKGQRHDHSRAGKEWSMVPVWGIVCGFAGLLEAMLNHAYSKKFPSPPVQKLMSKPDLANKKGFVGTFYGFRSTCLAVMVDAKNWLKDEFPKSKYFPRSVSRMPKWLIEKMEKDVHGNVGVAYFLGALVPFVGAIIQSGIFAKIQEKLDAKQAAKDKHKMHAGKAHHSEHSDTNRADANRTPQQQQAANTADTADANVADKNSNKTQPHKTTVKKDENSIQNSEVKSTEPEQGQLSTKETLPKQQANPPEKKTEASPETKEKPGHKGGQTAKIPSEDEVAKKGQNQPLPSPAVIADSRHPIGQLPKQESGQGQQPNFVQSSLMNPAISRVWNYELRQHQFRYPQQPAFVYFRPPGYS